MKLEKGRSYLFGAIGRTYIAKVNGEYLDQCILSMTESVYNYGERNRDLSYINYMSSFYCWANTLGGKSGGIHNGNAYMCIPKWRAESCATEIGDLIPLECKGKMIRMVYSLNSYKVKETSRIAIAKILSGIYKVDINLILAWDKFNEAIEFKQKQKEELIESILNQLPF